MESNTTWSNSTISGNSTLVWPPPNAGRSLQPDIAACTVLTLLIASAFVAMRFYVRGRVNHVLSASDWCILPALLCAAGLAGSSFEQMARGAGLHAWQIDPYAFPAFERAAWYGILFYNLSLTLTRISILLLYKRIFTYSWIKRAIQIVLILIVAIGIWLVVSVCTACMPLAAFWDWSLFLKGPVYCQPVNLWWANAALHIASDLVVMALPMPVLSSLNLPRRQKYAIIGVFALGFFVCIISIVRLVTLVELTEDASFDGSYTSANMIYWTTVEVNAAISCACIMTLKPLIQRVFPRLLSPSKGHREPALQWITPAHSLAATNPRHSFPISPLSPTHHHLPGRRPSSAATSTRTSTITAAKQNRASASASGGSLPHLNEHTADAMDKSRYYHALIAPCSGDTYLDSDMDHDLDLEAQRTRTHSVQSTTDGGTTGGGASTTEGEDETPLAGGGGGAAQGALRAPPRAHLRWGGHLVPYQAAKTQGVDGAVAQAGEGLELTEGVGSKAEKGEGGK